MSVHSVCGEPRRRGSRNVRSSAGSGGSQGGAYEVLRAHGPSSRHRIGHQGGRRRERESTRRGSSGSCRPTTSTPSRRRSSSRRRRVARSRSSPTARTGPDRTRRGSASAWRGAPTRRSTSRVTARSATPYTIARVLAAAVSKAGPFDLVLAGVKGVGSDNSLVGAMVAELLDLPHVSGVIKIEFGEGKLTAHREIEGGTEIVDAPLPCAGHGAEGAQRAALPVAEGDHGVEAGRRSRRSPRPTSASTRRRWPAKGARPLAWPSSCRRPRPVAPSLKGEDDPAAAARELARLLREQAKVI